MHLHFMDSHEIQGLKTEQQRSNKIRGLPFLLLWAQDEEIVMQRNSEGNSILKWCH